MIQFLDDFIKKHLSKSTRRLLKWILFVTLLTLTVTAVRWGFSTKEKVQAQAQQLKEIVLKLPSEQIVGIRILFQNKEVHFQKRRALWQIQDQTFELDQDRVKRLLSAVTNLEAQQLINAQEDLEKYGLAIPQKTVEISLRNKQKALILLGHKVPTQKLYYLQIHGKPHVYLLDEQIAEIFSDDVHHYGDLQIPKIDWTNLKEVQINLNKLNIKIEAATDTDLFTQFRFVEPLQYAKLSVSTEAFAKLWSLWAQRPLDKRGLLMNITQWQDYGLSEPAIKLNIQDSSETILDLSIGSLTPQGNDYYARLSKENNVFLIPKAYIQPFNTLTSFGLVNKFVALIPLAEVSSFSLLGKEEKFWGEVIHHDPAQEISAEYKFNGNIMKESVFQGIYETLVALRYERERELKVKLGRPVWDLTYYDKSGKTMKTVAFLSYNTRQYAVSVDGKLMPLTIGPAQLEKLIAKMRALSA